MINPQPGQRTNEFCLAQGLKKCEEVFHKVIDQYGDLMRVN